MLFLHQSLTNALLAIILAMVMQHVLIFEVPIFAPAKTDLLEMGELVKVCKFAWCDICFFFFFSLQKENWLPWWVCAAPALSLMYLFLLTTVWVDSIEYYSNHMTTDQNETRQAGCTNFAHDIEFFFFFFFLTGYFDCLQKSMNALVVLTTATHKPLVLTPLDHPAVCVTTAGVETGPNVMVRMTGFHWTWRLLCWHDDSYIVMRYSKRHWCVLPKEILNRRDTCTAYVWTIWNLRVWSIILSRMTCFMPFQLAFATTIQE